jgi:hypothetical protein
VEKPCNPSNTPPRISFQFCPKLPVPSIDKLLPISIQSCSQSRTTSCGLACADLVVAVISYCRARRSRTRPLITHLLSHQNPSFNQQLPNPAGSSRLVCLSLRPTPTFSSGLVLRYASIGFWGSLHGFVSLPLPSFHEPNRFPRNRDCSSSRRPDQLFEIGLIELHSRWANEIWNKAGK